MSLLAIVSLNILSDSLHALCAQLCSRFCLRYIFQSFDIRRCSQKLISKTASGLTPLALRQTPTSTVLVPNFPLVSRSLPPAPCRSSSGVPSLLATCDLCLFVGTSTSDPATCVSLCMLQTPLHSYSSMPLCHTILILFFNHLLESSSLHVQ